MSILKTCLLIGVISLAASSGSQCSAGGMPCQTGQCHFPTYIQGCFTYATPSSCLQCEYSINIYYVKTGNTCTYSPSPDTTNCCRTFIYPSGQCSQCATGLVLVDGKCVDKKIVGCLVKSKTGTCLNCAIEYSLFGGQCFKKIVGCVRYASTGACQACDRNYEYINGYCVPAIIADQLCQYPWVLNGNQCNIPGCQIQYDYGCAQCQSSYKLLPDGSCRRGTIQGCITYSSDGLCLQCKKPFYTQYQGYCIAYGCVKINEQGRCTSCNNNKGFQLTNDGYCKIINCLVSDQNSCLVCQAGYVQTFNGCQRQDARKICTTCARGFYLAQNGQCKPKQPGCLTYTKYKCSSCEDNLYLTRDYECIQKQYGCIYQDGVCMDCIAPFKRYRDNLGNGRCMIQGCAQAMNTGCRVCRKPYILTQAGSCTYENCNQVVDGRCISCMEGYAISHDGLCYLVDPYCKAYDFGGKCIECKLGYYIDRKLKIEDQKCKQQKYGCNYIDGRCASCRAPFAYNPQLQLCQIDGCLSYFLGGCKTCAAGYDLRYNSCKLPNCLISHKGHCAQCDPGYVLKSDGTCVNKDEFCWKYDETSGLCMECAPQYFLSKLNKKCQPREPGCLYNDLDRCYACDKPFYFDGTRCEIYGCMALSANGCDQCYYPMEVTKQGLCSVVNCDRMDGEKCVICKAGFTIVDDGSCQVQDPKCLVYGDKGCKKCVKGYRVDKNNRCQYADEHCWDFSEKGSCTNCDRLYFLNSWNKCEIKDSNCAAYSGGRCIECKNYFYIYRGLCYPNAKGCAKQKNIKVCERCESGYKLDFGVCTPQITKLTWDSVDMDFWSGDSDEDKQISKDVFTVGKTNKLNLDGAITKGKGKIIYSTIVTGRKSFQVDDDTDANGWTPLNPKSGEFIGVLLENMQTFYAVDIKYIQGSTLTRFAIEQSDDGIVYYRINQFTVTKLIPGTVQTFYFTPVHARSMRIVILEGTPNIKFEFYYSNGQNVYVSETNTYIQEQTEISILDSLKGQLFETKDGCVDKELCWMGLELCQAKPIIGFTLLSNKGSKGIIDAVAVKYSQDGVKFLCYNDCKEAPLTEGTYRLNPRVTASKLRVYPTKWTGEPSYSVTFEY